MQFLPKVFARLGLKVIPLLLVVMSASFPQAAPVRRVVMVIIDRIALVDLVDPDLPNLAWCVRHGGIGLMNTRTGNGAAFAAEHAYISLGAGSRGVGTPTSGAAFAAGDEVEHGTAAEILARNTGYRPGPGNLVLPEIAAVAALNAVQDHPVRPGLLGSVIRQAGLATCAIGNADALDQPGRQVVSLVMDEHGVVDAGAIGPALLRADSGWPFGMRTDYPALLRAFDRLAGGAALTAIDLGDTSRLDLYALDLTPERQAGLRRRAMLAADRFLGSLRRRLDPRGTLLLILCPTPDAAAWESGNTLTPLLAVGPGFSRGWLASATTRRPGIVTNTDVAPTVLSFLGLDVPPEVSGRPLRTVPGPSGPDGLRALDARIAATDFLQGPLLKFYVVMLDVTFALCALFLFWPGLPGRRWLQALLLAAAGFPLVLLLTPLRQGINAFLPWLAIWAILPAGLLFVWPRRPLLPLLFLFAGTATAIILDQLWGAPLARFSLLSYSPIAGSRFYGLGNEYMGVLIGATVTAAGLAFTRAHGRRWLTPLAAAVFILFAAVLGVPGLGTNVGGFLGAAVGFAAAFLLLAEKRFSARPFLLIGGAALLALLVLAWADALRPPGAQSHLGRLVNQMRQGGFGPFWEIIQRKLAMNIKLIRFSGWSRVALFALGSMLVTAVWPHGRGRDFCARYPYLAKAVWASLAGGAAALAFNDSGVVAAGTLLIFPTAAWLYLLLAEKAPGSAGPPASGSRAALRR